MICNRYQLHFPPILSVPDDANICALGKYLHSSRDFAWGVYVPRVLLKLSPSQEEALHRASMCIVKDISFA